MARLNKSILSSISGRTGDVVFRTSRGTTYISRRPSGYRIPRDAESTRRREIFTLSSSLCAAMNKLKILKELWKSPESSSFTAMHASALKIFYSGGNLGDIPLSPFPPNLEVQVNGITLSGETLSVTIDPLLPISPKNRLISMQGVIRLSTPGDPNEKLFRFLPLFSGYRNCPPGEEITFTVDFPGSAFEFLKMYTGRELLVIFITGGIDMEIRNVSRTSLYLIP